MYPFGEGAHFARVFDILPHGLIFVDTDWRVMSANSAAERLLRISRQEISGKLYGRSAECLPP